MGRCWTCGTQMSGYGYTCGVCRGIEAAQDLEQTMERGLKALQDSVASGLAELASVLEWGFGEVRWELQQQTQVLQSIDQTLRTPSQTRANESRLNAEELRRRGVLDKSEEFFLKALDDYPLDYRAYVGLGETYLRMSKFDEAMRYFEKSLPHAPVKEFDYKSYSYRLIGHAQFCKEDSHGAVESLHSAISLSPDYPDALYDFAQYSCLLSDQDVDHIASDTFHKWGGNWALRKYDVIRLLCVQKAIRAKPIYFHLAERERNFDAHRDTIKLALSNLLDNARGKAENSIDEIERLVPEVESAISNANRALDKSKAIQALKSDSLFNDTKARVKLVKEKTASKDYLAVLDAQPLADDVLQALNKVRDLANQEAKQYRELRSQKVSNAWSKVPAAIFGWPLLFAVLGGIAGEFLGGLYHTAINQEPVYTWSYFLTGLYIGIPTGFFYGIYSIVKQLK